MKKYNNKYVMFNTNSVSRLVITKKNKVGVDHWKGLCLINWSGCFLALSNTILFLTGLNYDYSKIKENRNHEFHTRIGIPGRNNRIRIRLLDNGWSPRCIERFRYKCHRGYIQPIILYVGRNTCSVLTIRWMVANTHV